MPAALKIIMKNVRFDIQLYLSSIAALFAIAAFVVALFGNGDEVLVGIAAMTMLGHAVVTRSNNWLLELISVECTCITLGALLFGITIACEWYYTMLVCTSGFIFILSTFCKPDPDVAHELA